MRWRYYDPANPSEAAAHAQVTAAIDRWWQAFASKTPAIVDLFKNRSNWDLPAWMHKSLGAVDPRFMWEYGPALRGTGHRLVITPEADAFLRPLLDTLLQRAPAIPGWEFYPYRPPESLDLALETVRGRTQRDLRDARATVVAGESNRIDLCFYSPTTTGPEDRQALHSAFIAAETLLGEELLDRWVGLVEVQPAPRSTGLRKLFGSRTPTAPNLLPLDRLKPTVDATISAMIEQLPPNPRLYLARPSDDDQKVYSLVKFEPEKADDYPRYDDLLTALTSELSLFQAMHSPRFFSGRFSRGAETFCFLKLENSDPAFRSRIENSLYDILAPTRAGCALSGGSGLRYSYIHVVLGDLAHAIPLLRAGLSSVGIPRRSWLMFFDADLSHEWIALHPDAPPPPEPVEV